MILASYNLENLFLRARALNQRSWAEGKQALEQQRRLNALLSKPRYAAADKAKILQLLTSLGLDKADDGGPFALLRQNRGKLVTRRRTGCVEIVAQGRADWIGWVELKMEQVNDVATRATARVVRDLNADVLAVVEAESRPALVRFSDGLLAANGGRPYPHVMLVDGNDERGIDVGLMAQGGYDIESVASHVDDHDKDGRIFSRDCPVFTINTPIGNRLSVVVNHLKSQGYGGQGANDRLRARQARRVRKIYAELVEAGEELIAVVGDLNDTPDSPALAPLLRRTDLRDVSEHSAFDDGGRPGTFRNGTSSHKIDYILMSPKLFAVCSGGAISRMGVWGGRNGTLFPHYPEITSSAEAASDHAAIWAEVAI